MMYNYLVVGSGLYGAIFAHEAKKSGKTVLVVDKRPNIAGNVYTEKTEGINVHNMEHIFSILTTRKYGIISLSLQSSTGLQTARSLIIKGNFTVFLLICIHLIKCGVW